jgi:hypothetical protein
MISFGFEDGFADSFDEGLGAGTAFRGLSETGRIETFFLAGTEAKAGAGTRGTETEAGTGVALAIETFGIVGIVETEAGTIGIAELAGARAGIGVALGTEALSSYAQLNKNSR